MAMALIFSYSSLFPRVITVSPSLTLILSPHILYFQVITVSSSLMLILSPHILCFHDFLEHTYFYGLSERDISSMLYFFHSLIAP